MFLAEGLVDFPANDYSEWEDTEEGHTSVCLVVLAQTNIDLWDEFPVNLEHPEGELMGDNLQGSPLDVYVSKYMFEESVIMSEDIAKDEIDYCCFIPLGIIKWTGFDYISKRYWYCSLDDLTSEGIDLYHIITNLYHEKTARLLTFIKV